MTIWWSAATRSAYTGIPARRLTSTFGCRCGQIRPAQLVATLQAFGFDLPELSPGLFLKPDRVIRLGTPPLRIELLTTISGVEFDECYARGISATLGGVNVRVISLEDLKTNKRAAGRHQDLADLDHLP